jgi:hypothetical protein
MYDSAQNEIDLIAQKSGVVSESRFQASAEKKAFAAKEITRFESAIERALAEAKAEWDAE